MNKKKSIWSGVSVLIAAVLAIVAFVRSDTQIWLLTAAFTIWAIWVTAAFVFPYIQEQENEKRRAARRAAYDAQRQSLRHCLWKRRMASAHCCSAMLTTGSPHI